MDASQPLLEVRDLVMTFGGARAVDGVSFDLAAGAMMAVIGPNGCGKTTLFNMITGVLAPTSGAIRLGGKPIAGHSPVAIAKDGVVRKFQVPSIFPALSVRDNLAVAGAISGAGGKTLTEMLDFVGLAADAAREAGALSHGQKQWLELALVLMVKPRLILLDEPAAGMTRSEKTRTIELITRLRADPALSLIVIEHDMHFIEALQCPVKAMMRGKLVAEGSYDEVRRDPQLRDGYLGRRTVHG